MLGSGAARVSNTQQGDYPHQNAITIRKCGIEANYRLPESKHFQLQQLAEGIHAYKQ